MNSRVMARWWERAIIYQIYPRSFQDSNGDGVGDLRGIIQRLPYLVELGVDAVWLSPIFTSPMADFGYDISDYTDIDPLFGTLSDFDRLLEITHGHGLKLILDLVPNHTSSRHPWFAESRSSRSSAKRDWYIWRDPAPSGGPPNNWMSEFGGSAWELDASTGQYYYHAFLAAQPDLNWRNPDVRSAVYDVMRFWLRKGVDGFRVDVIWHLIKDQHFRDNPASPNYLPGQPPHHAIVPLYTADRPEIHEVIREMRKVMDEFTDRLLIGEIYLPIERLVAYYGRELEGLHLPFNFTLLNVRWHAESIARLIAEYEAALPAGGWPNWVLGNHDRPRIASRVGARQARVAAMLLLTLRGTPTIYYGDEIGMKDVPIAPDQIRDPFERNVPGLGLGRDGCRTPMQWDASSFAGFCNAEPWLPVDASYQSCNIAAQQRDPNSIYNLYRELIALRRTRRALTAGTYHPLTTAGNLLVFIRKHASERLLVALNMDENPAEFSMGGARLEGKVLLSSQGDRRCEKLEEVVKLTGGEGLICELEPESSTIGQVSVRSMSHGP